MKIAILGAGSIGGFVGGAWQAAGLEATFIGRKRIAGDVAEFGMTLSDQDGWEKTFAPETIDFVITPEALADADLIALAVKSGATEEAGRQIADHSRPGTPVLSLQNGISNVDTLRGLLGERNRVIRGMVPYNVAYLGKGHFHKGVAGSLYAEDVPVMRDLAERVSGGPADIALSNAMAEIAWGKLLVNLNNAVNALSGLPLRAQLAQRDYRRVMAATLREGRQLLLQSGIRPANVAPIPSWLMPAILEAPNWLFDLLFMRKLKIDARARSSMADDLTEGRKTEIDYLNGELLALADRLGRPAPVNRAIVSLIRNAEDGGRHDWSASELRRATLG